MEPVKYLWWSDIRNKNCVLSCYLFISCCFVAFGLQMFRLAFCVSRAHETSQVFTYLIHECTSNLSIRHLSLIYSLTSKYQFKCDLSLKKQNPNQCRLLLLLTYCLLHSCHQWHTPKDKRQKTKMQTVKVFRTVFHIKIRFRLEINTASQARHVLTHAKHTHVSAFIPLKLHRSYKRIILFQGRMRILF